MGMFARMFGGFSAEKKAAPHTERRNSKERRFCKDRRDGMRDFDIDRRSGAERRSGVDWHAWI